MIAAACCANATLVDVDDALALAYERVTPRVAPTAICASCGSVGVAGVRVTPWSRTKLRARQLVANGNAGSAAALQLPKLLALAPHAKEWVLETNASGRIDADLNSIRASEQLRLELRGELENKMRLRLRQPRAVAASGLNHPAIMHIGLVYKFVDDAHLDAGHVRFARYVSSVLNKPIEIWLDVDNGRDVFRVIGALAVGRNRYHFMHVLVEAQSHIVTTAYVVDVAKRIEQYRTGRPILLSWAT